MKSDRRNGVIRKLLGVGILMALAAWPARAQITPKYEISGGFQYMSYLNTETFSHINMLGGDGSFTYNYYRWLGFVGDLSAGHNRLSSPTDAAVNGESTTVVTFMGGPRFYPFGHHKFTFFGDAIFGGDFLHQSVPAVPPFPAETLNTASFGWGAELGADYSLGDHWAFRFQGGYLSTRFYSSTAGSQGNYRAIFGVAYRFGVRGPHRHK
jgi:hypothetical protein